MPCTLGRQSLADEDAGSGPVGRERIPDLQGGPVVGRQSLADESAWSGPDVGKGFPTYRVARS
ncbi:genomic scaffold, msy_sf_25 [Methylocaldum marinum]|uniref:Genomic scaffold, msy_sf_25 n=1 Tax=Methylocaldum marinum TaxID=1432792 RepID=A0A286P3Z8_9GAMM|nr:genomic scaffold, msy_sf_25 [Methylocaldum marinum]